jgi:hypothetical protein
VVVRRGLFHGSEPSYPDLGPAFDRLIGTGSLVSAIRPTAHRQDASGRAVSRRGAQVLAPPSTAPADCTPGGTMTRESTAKISDFTHC